MTRLRAVALIAFACGGCDLGIPNSEDAEMAYSIGRFIAQGYGQFEDRETVQESGRGKTWYAGPSASGDPRFTFYGVTSPEDIARIESLAREALRQTEGVNSVTLSFFEKHDWRVGRNGSKSLEPGRLLKKVRYDRDD